MQPGPPIQTTRDCEGIEIPDGAPVRIPAGTEVRVTQALGGSFTVMSEWGFMLRIAGKDADVLGLEVPVSTDPTATADSGDSLQEQIMAELETCYDPEIPVNIVELGLIHSSDVSDLPDGGKRIDIKMALTSPGCGMGDVLRYDVEEKLSRLPGVKQVHVELVMPLAWDESQMSEAARLELGLMW